MIIALIGAQGTGKTTIFNELGRCLPRSSFFSEGTRHQMPSFGFGNPYELIDQHGVGVFEVLTINAWATTDEVTNTLLAKAKNNLVITDRCAVDNYAYYLTLKAGAQDEQLGELIRQMAVHYTQLVDRFIYFPTGRIPLVADRMRPDNTAYQQAVDTNIWKALQDLRVDPQKIHSLEAVGIDERVAEVLSVLPLPASWTDTLFAPTYQ